MYTTEAISLIKTWMGFLFPEMFNQKALILITYIYHTLHKLNPYST